MGAMVVLVVALRRARACPMTSSTLNPNCPKTPPRAGPPAP
jgi:hypothetical protein